jgi:hypothetical protein
MQHLDGDWTFVPNVVRAIDGRHTAGADFALDAVTVDEGLAQSCQLVIRSGVGALVGSAEQCSVALALVGSGEQRSGELARRLRQKRPTPSCVFARGNEALDALAQRRIVVA